MDQVSSALRVFEVEVISHMRVIGSQVDDNEATSIHRQLVFDGPYHLVVVFLTEASPDGGWWISSEDSKGGAGLAPEKVFLWYHIKALTKLANNARSARLFMLSCGTNLFAASCLESIYKTVGSARGGRYSTGYIRPSVLFWCELQELPALRLGKTRNNMDSHGFCSHGQTAF
ncbi:hypothetical protein RhiTH_009482 [Rhizoctonia solani]